jgi:hypothetical protein
MKIIEKDKVPDILPVKGGRETLLRVMLLQVKVGEALEMGKEEWLGKNPPYKIVAKVKKTHGFEFKYGKKADGSGWIFKRVK